MEPKPVTQTILLMQDGEPQVHDAIVYVIQSMNLFLFVNHQEQEYRLLLLHKDIVGWVRQRDFPQVV